MSEDFLSRWSRRKRNAEVDDRRALTDAERQAEREAPGEEVRPAEPAAPAQATLDLLKDLPPIESITAATDIRPFLAPGVPVDMARAALRRAWTADPQIRDFVGLADYDWDFHAPGAIPGFGALEMTDELRAALVRVLGPMSGGGPGPAVERDVSAQPEEIAHDIKKPLAALPTDAGKTSQRGDSPAALPLPKSADDAAAQHESRDASTPSMVRRGHGRALPK